MSGNTERKTVGCTVPIAIYDKTFERADQLGLSPASYLRNLLLADLGAPQQEAANLNPDDIELIAATVAAARKLLASLPKETLSALALETRQSKQSVL